MQFGINTFLFTSPFTTEDIRLFPKFSSWGYDSVEIAMEQPALIDPGKVKTALKEHQLVCGSVSGAWGPGRDLRGSAEEQRNAKSYCMEALERTAALDCPTFIGPLYSAVGRAEAIPEDLKKQQWEMVVSHLQDISRRAQELGITICLEPLNRYETDFINTCDQALQMIADVSSSHLKILLDSFHMNIEEKNPAEAILKAGAHLGHFHACGCDRGTPGNDHMDWQGMVRALKRINYQGDIVVESFTPDVKIIAKAASIWRQIEPSREAIAKDGLAFLRKAFSD